MRRRIELADESVNWRQWRDHGHHQRNSPCRFTAARCEHGRHDVWTRGSRLIPKSAAPASSQQLEGRVESLPPTTAPNTLVVFGKTVKTDSGTRFEQGGAAKSFADVLIGMRVHVEGTAKPPNQRR
jgi:hypothetical protein